MRTAFGLARRRYAVGLGTAVAVALLASWGCRGCGQTPSVHYQAASDGLPRSGLWKSHIALGDVNGDGFQDLGVVSRLGDGPHVFLFDADGTWRDASAGLPRDTFCGGGMQFADINKDGKMDVAVADHCRGTAVFLGDGKGTWEAWSTGLPTYGCEDLAVADFNADGCADVAIVAASGQGVRAFLGDCTGNWVERSEGLETDGWGNAIIAADFDRDGHVDLAATHAEGPRVWLGDGTGGWRTASKGLPVPNTGGIYWGLATGDINGDGLLDLATGAAFPGAEAFIQERGPQGPTWRSVSDGIPGYAALGVALSDLNRDGYADLVIAGRAVGRSQAGVYGLHPLLGDGRGHWQPAPDTGLPNKGRERIWGVGVADINNDGVLDVAAAFGDLNNPRPRLPVAAESESTQPSGSDTPSAPPRRARRPPPSVPERGYFGGVDVWLGKGE